jgi:hypothetical protein
MVYLICDNVCDIIQTDCIVWAWGPRW